MPVDVARGARLARAGLGMLARIRAVIRGGARALRHALPGASSRGGDARRR